MTDGKPPSIRKEFREIVKFGHKRSDPFFWLKAANWPEIWRDPSLLPPEIRDHLDAENEYFRNTAREFAPLTAAVAREMKQRLKTRDASVIERDGSHEYWSEFRGGGNYRVYMQKDMTTGVERIVLDGDKESIGKKFFDVAAVVHGPDHKTAAYMVDHEGAGNFSVKFRDIETGLDLPEILTGAKGTVAWSKDATRLYYTECDGRNIPKRVKMHVIGTDPKEDAVIYEENDPRLSLGIRQSLSGDYIFIESRESAAVIVETKFVRSDGADSGRPVTIAPRSEGHEYHVEHRGDDFFIRTNTGGAVNGKIVRTPVKTPGMAHWVDMVPARSDACITGFAAFKDFMVRKELHGTLPRLVVSDYEGNEKTCVFSDEPHSLNAYPGKSFDAVKLVVEQQTPANPGILHEFDFHDGKKTLLEQTRLPDGHRPEDYIVERKFIKSRDGVTDVPVTILRHKLTKTDGTAPLYLYGYGAYGGGLSADFNSAAISLADRGVIYAIAHVRGGNEKGPDWYQQGRGEKKWNSFHDFIDTAEQLPGMGYGEKGKIVIEGRSAGGLLMGVTLNERRDLFVAAIVGEAFLDVLNTMSDPSLPWVEEEKAEWGDAEKEADFHRMASYSPCDNIAPGEKYPAVLATTGVADSCVMYWEPAKWIARLRDEAAGGPFLLRTNTEGGHDGASARLDSIDDTAGEVAFALHHFRKCGYDLTPVVTRQGHNLLHNAKKNGPPPSNP